MKRHKMPDVLKRFPGGEDETVTDPGTVTPETPSEGSGENTGSEEDDD